MQNTTKYMAIALIWLGISMVAYQNTNTLIFGGMIGLVATAIIINNE